MTPDQAAEHPTFLAFCRVWEQDIQAPLPLADWLREEVGDPEADAAVWAAGQSPTRTGQPTTA